MTDARRMLPAWPALVLLQLLPSAAPAQFDTTGWRFAAREARVETFRGRQALTLRDGAAWMPASSFENGTIEFDLAVTDSMGFAGVQFRMQDEDDYEHFYVRPFMSGNPDATQYQPVYNGNAGWQIYVGDRYNAPLRLRTDGWIHVKIVVDRTRAEVHVDGAVQHIPALLRPAQSGMVGLQSTIAPARFANVRVRPVLDPPPALRDIPALPAPAGTIGTWSVSSVIEEKRLSGTSRLSEPDLAGLTWSAAAPTERGIVNLGSLTGKTADRNTVFAAVTLAVDAPRTVRLRYGFSDRVRIYLDGRLLYAGNDGFRTRDYRFLGTVGLFDELNLPLTAGPNALLFAVSESFGGWAVTAALEDTAGVRVSAGCGRVVCR